MFQNLKISKLYNLMIKYWKKLLDITPMQCYTWAVQLGTDASKQYDFQKETDESKSYYICKEYS